MPPAKVRKRFHWWFVPIAVVLVVTAAATGIYFYASSRIHKTMKYVNTWSQAAAAVSQSSASSTAASSSAQQALDAIDAGSFPGGNASDYPIIQVKPIDSNVENILLVGIDATQGDGAEGTYGANRADSIMVLSINHKTNSLKIISLMRDTKTYFPNTQSYHKLNAAFSYGGIGLQIDVINYAYHLDIQKYMQFDFDGFSHIIDAIGGVPIYLTAAEASGDKIKVGTTAGTYTLDGAHALGYTRERYIDTDFMRTQRQRNVMMAVYNKFKTADTLAKLSALNACMGYFKTNVPTTELTGTLMSLVGNLKDIQQITIPQEDDGLYTTEKSPIWFWDINWDAENAKLHSIIYG